MADINNVMNISRLSTIPNSVGEFCIYTYKADFEKTEDFKRVGFFNPGVNIFAPGDMIRVFQYTTRNLDKYYEFIVTDVQKSIKKVSVAIIREVKLEGKIVG